MTDTMASSTNQRSSVAFGPVAEGFGSWEWVGREMCRELSADYRTVEFSDLVPEANVVVFIKFAPSGKVLSQIDPKTRLIYCPIDFFGHVSEIERAAVFLRRCSRVIVHNRRLERYFRSFTRVEYLDHHVRFFNQLPAGCQEDGCLLWTGVRTNLPALVEWVNAYRLPAPLLVLTNHEELTEAVDPASFGFQTRNQVVVRRWSETTHLESISQSRAAIDIRGADFRERHKPPTKAMDFLAAGLPLAMNRGAASLDHLSSLGFECVRLPEKDDAATNDVLQTCYERWLSPEYQDDSRRFGMAIRELLSRQRIGNRLKKIIEQTLSTAAS